MTEAEEVVSLCRHHLQREGVRPEWGGRDRLASIQCNVDILVSFSLKIKDPKIHEESSTVQVVICVLVTVGENTGSVSHGRLASSTPAPL